MISPRFLPGDKVRIDDRPVSGHCRTPFYLRGRSGVVEDLHGRYRNPEQLAYHRPGVPMRYLYRIRFDQREVWPEYVGSDGDDVVADIFEHWLTKQD